MTILETYTYAVIKPNRRPKLTADIEAMKRVKSSIEELYQQGSVTGRDYEKLLQNIDELYEQVQDGLKLETAIEYALL